MKCSGIITLILCIININVYAQQSSQRIDSAIINHQRNYPLPSIRILDKYNYIIAPCHGIKFWRLSDGIVDTVLLIPGDHEYVHHIVVAKDQTKIFASLLYLKSPKRNKILGAGPDTIWKFETEIFCIGVTDKKFLWRTLIQDEWLYDGLGLIGDSLLYGIGSKKSIVLETKTGTAVVKKHPLIKNKTKNIVFSLSGRYLLYWDTPGFKTFNTHEGSQLNIWDFSKNKKVYSKYFYGKGTWAATFLSDENNIVEGNYDGSLFLWTLDKNKTKQIWQTGSNQNERDIIYIFSPPNSDKIIGVQVDAGLNIFRYPTMERVSLFKNSGFNYGIGGGTELPMCFSADGKYLVLNNDGNLCLFKTDTWQAVWCVPCLCNKD